MKRIEFFSLYDKAGMEKHLEKMAQKGWMIKNIGSFFWEYEKIQPQNIKFTVTYFPTGSDFAPNLSDKQEFMISLCEDDGWQLALAKGQLQIFYTLQENPREIETDPVVQVENMCKAIKLGTRANSFLFLIALLQIGMMGYRMTFDISEFLSNNLNILSFAAWFIVIIFYIYDFAFFKIWAFKSKKYAQTGMFYLPKTSNTVKIISLTAVVLLIFMYLFSFNLYLTIFALILFLIIAVSQQFKEILKKNKVSKKTNLVSTIVLSVVLTFTAMGLFIFFALKYDLLDQSEPVGYYTEHGIEFKVYNDDIPLEIEDILDTDFKDFSYEKRENKTILMTKTECRQWPLSNESGAPMLEYTVIKSDIPFLLNAVTNQMINENHNEVVDGQLLFTDNFFQINSDIWKADSVYQRCYDGNPTDQYILIYKDKIINIDFSWQPAQEEIEKTADILLNI